MDNECDALDRGWRKTILIVDNPVYYIGLMGRSIKDMYSLPAAFIHYNKRPSGSRRGQRKHNYDWS